MRYAYFIGVRQLHLTMPEFIADLAEEFQAGLVVLHPFQPAHHPLLLLQIITEAHDDIDTNVCNCI